MQYSVTLATTVAIVFQLIMAISLLKNITFGDFSMYYRIRCCLGMLVYLLLWVGIVWMLFTMKGY